MGQANTSLMGAVWEILQNTPIIAMLYLAIYKWSKILFGFLDEGYSVRESLWLAFKKAFLICAGIILLGSLGTAFMIWGTQAFKMGLEVWQPDTNHPLGATLFFFIGTMIAFLYIALTAPIRRKVLLDIVIALLLNGLTGYSQVIGVFGQFDLKIWFIHSILSLGLASLFVILPLRQNVHGQTVLKVIRNGILATIIFSIWIYVIEYVIFVNQMHSIS